jgi:rSAM/selenodomain-associated transferase 2/rSAM/selenodomain-associated transferase 1
MPSATERLIIFARYPRPGSVKTRMIPLLGPRGAADLHRRMVEHTLSWAGRLGFCRGVGVEIRCEGARPCRMKGAFEGREGLFKWRPQAGGGLGSKMGNAFRDAFGSGARLAVIVGTDIPDLTDRLVARAFDMLGGGRRPASRRYDMVLGPARDGGYYLIGFTGGVPQRRIDGVMADVPWGTDRVFEITRERAAAAGLSCGLLDVLDDVDLPRDLPVWERAAERGRAAAPLETLSVVIPALNEEARIERAIGSALQADREVEVIVVDGGSSDGTVQRARATGAVVIEGSAPRSRQMNVGARFARGDALLFIHADTTLPPSYDRDLFEALGRSDTAAGAFELGIEGAGFGLRAVEYMAAMRSRVFGLPYGDQGLFVRASLFYEIGGFREMPIMEDFELMVRLAKRGAVTVAPRPVVTSARRWKALGVVRATLINQVVIAGYLLGVSPERIARFYRRERGLGGR